MKVTTKPGVGNKTHIYLDGEYAFTLYDDFWFRAGINEGEELSEEELAPLREEALFRLAYEKGASFLEMRAYSVHELTEKLRQKSGEKPASRAVQKLLRQGFLNDERYAADKCAYLYETKFYDRRRIALELKKCGIDGEIVSKTLKTLDNEPVERIILLLTTKYSEKLNEEKEVRRLVARLMRMGYSYYDIRAAFERCGVNFSER